MEKRAVARAAGAEKRSQTRDEAAEKRASVGLNAALERFAERIQASNNALAASIADSLAFLKEVLRDDQRNRRFWRWLLIFGMVLNFGLLGALGYNAVEGAKARAKLVDRSAEQGELLKKVDRSLAILENATGPEAQAKASASLGEAFVAIDCNNQRAIQRAMQNLNAPYELTENCQ